MSQKWSLAKIDSQGRVTIPKNIREYLDLKHGDHVEVMFRVPNDVH